MEDLIARGRWTDSSVASTTITHKLYAIPHDTSFPPPFYVLAFLVVRVPDWMRLK